MPPDFGEAAFLIKTGWRHQDYEAAPDELVNQMVMLYNAEAEAAKAQMQSIESKRR